jgi:hypothetical protein
MTLMIALLMHLSGLHGARAGAHPAELAARWVEEGAQAEWRLTLAPDGRARKERRRQCLERQGDEPCLPLRYDGNWDAAGRKLALHFPGSMEERFGYALKGRLLTLTDAHGQQSVFAFQLLPASGDAHPPALAHSWQDGPRVLELRASGDYIEHDEDGAAKGRWHADADRVTLEPEGGGDETTFKYRVRGGTMVVQDAAGKARTLQAR